jgi:hypothetical protein
MNCPRCNSIMVQKSPETIYLTYPAQYDSIMWCKCGYGENRGRVYDKTPQQRMEDEWDERNKKQYTKELGVMS